TLNAIHDKMHHAVRAAGGRIDAIFYCPHAPDSDCECRKPKPGMLERIAACFNVDLAEVYAVGDSRRDLEAAEAAGARPALVLTGKGEEAQKEGGLPKGTLVFDDLAAAAEHILKS
ncbi:MAG: HAD-IIIA family hydrolase, partial [Candidatus Accumulibacter sp.]|nr:HAD-IIIA family hydrolase [Accumulibacter sp.]